MNTIFFYVAIWFGLAVLTEVTSSFFLWLFLRRHGMDMIFGFTGMPGYLERIYLGWCRREGRSGKTVVVLRTLSIVNVLIAGVTFVLLQMATLEVK